MPHVEDARPRRKLRLSLRRTRLACGLVLFAYVALHYTNHALGNVSVDAMERGLALQKLIWQSAPGAILLYAALTIHLSLDFWALYERRQFRWTRMEATQLALGLTLHSFPAGLARRQHTRGVKPVRDQQRLCAGAPQVLGRPASGRGSAGRAAASRLDPRLHRAPLLAQVEARLHKSEKPPPVVRGAPADAGAARLLSGRQANPAAGREFILAGRESDPGRIGTPDENALLIHIRDDTLVALAGLLAAAILARGLRRLWEHWVGSIVLTYPEEVYAQAGLEGVDLPAHEVDARGRVARVKARSVANAADLAALIGA